MAEAPMRALYLREGPVGIAATVEPLDEADLPPGDLDVRVLYSSVNYKDALAVTGAGRVVRASYPFVPGIDLVGEVIRSRSHAVAEGEYVIQTGRGLGESRWGGYATLQRVDATNVVRLPDGMDPVDAMSAGTAGLTAALAVAALLDHQVPTSKPVLVTGATGGVGSFSVMLLRRLGYRVVAVTAKHHEKGYLHDLGAEMVLGRSEFGAGAARALDTGRWAGCIDSVGGRTLEAVLSQVVTHGSVAACGLAGGAELETTVFPFILRGVNLLGIDSNTCTAPAREAAWAMLRDAWGEFNVRPRTSVVSLADVPRVCADLLDGRVTGRMVVDLDAR